MSGLYAQNFSSSTATATAARALSPHIRTPPDVESQYLTELLKERQKLGPFIQVLPICSRLLNQEILRVSGRIPKQGLNDYEILQRGSPSLVPSSDVMPNYRGTSFGSRHGLPHNIHSGQQGMNMEWQTTPPSPSSYTMKRILRLEIPADSFPNFNFVGRLLGPRGNSLKRVEASTGCRVYIRGKGSIKDPDKEESLRGRPGYEHLNDPLHVLVEAELPANIVDWRLKQAQDIIEELLKPVYVDSHFQNNSQDTGSPTRTTKVKSFSLLGRMFRENVDESQDFYKRQQLRELAMLNSNLREESPRPSGSVSPLITSSGMKRAKTGL